MAITYTLGTNIIAVTGYSSGTPCNFTDLHNADKAGTLELLDGTIDADPDTFSLDEAVRPTDLLALQLDITCTARVGATCDIDGEDAWGNAISENGIDISSGSATTTEYFSVVDASGITVDGMTNDDDFDIEQGQWGVVWKQGDTQFVLDAKLYVMSASYFADEDKAILFSKLVTTGNNQFCFIAINGSEVRLGRAVDVTNKTSSGGCMIQALSDYSIAILYNDVNADLYIYSSLLTGEGASYINAVINMRDPSRLWNSILSSSRLGEMTGGDFYRLNIQEPAAVALGGMSGASDYEDIIASDGIGAQTYPFLFSKSPTTVFGTQSYNYDWAALLQTQVGARYCINCTLDSWVMWIRANITGPVYRQYTFDMKVVDGDGTGISGATVSMDDTNGNNIFSEATDGSGDIAQQTVTYKTYDRVASTAGFVDTEVTFSPHTVTISKAGHATRTIIYTIDRQREEIEKLAGIPQAIEYSRRRVPGIVGEMIER